MRSYAVSKDRKPSTQTGFSLHSPRYHSLSRKDVFVIGGSIHMISLYNYIKVEWKCISFLSNKGNNQHCCTWIGKQWFAQTYATCHNVYHPTRDNGVTRVPYTAREMEREPMFFWNFWNGTDYLNTASHTFGRLQEFTTTLQDKTRTRA